MASKRERLTTDILADLTAARNAGRGFGVRRLLGRAVSMTHLHVLHILRTAGPMPVSEIARALDVSAAGATGIVSRMEERGLIERRRDAGDRRVVTIVLAPGGDAALAEIEGRGRDFMSQLLARLSLPELEQLGAGLRALGRAREELGRERGDIPEKERSA